MPKSTKDAIPNVRVADPLLPADLRETIKTIIPNIANGLGSYDPPVRVLMLEALSNFATHGTFEW